MKSYKPYIILVSLFIGLGFSSCEESEILTWEEREYLRTKDSISIALFPYYAPYQFKNKRESINGIFYDYLNLIEEKINYQFVEKRYDIWLDVLDEAQAKKVDLILEAQETEERKEYLNFYPIFFSSEFVIITKRSKEGVTSLESLYGKTIALPEGFAIADLLGKHRDNLKIRYAVDDKSCLSLVQEGKVDAYIGPKAVASHYIKTLGLDQLVIQNGIGYSYEPAIAVDNNNAILNSIIAKASAKISSKEKEQLIANWLYEKAPPFYKDQQFWIVFLTIVLFLIALVLFLNKVLKEKISKIKYQLEFKIAIAQKHTQVKTEFINNVGKKIESPLLRIQENVHELALENIDSINSKKITGQIIKDGNNILSHIDRVLKISESNPQRVSSAMRPRSQFLSQQNLEIQRTMHVYNENMPPVTVLIAEDGDLNFLLLKTFLEKITRHKVTISRARDGQEAVTYCENNSKVDIIFMDIKMPIMDGFEATKRIKSIWPTVPIVAQTAFTAKESIERVFNAGCDAFISKPIDKEKLEKTLTTYLTPLQAVV